MHPTLFSIPNHDPYFSIPIFGFGWLLAIWGLLSAALLVWLVRRQGWSADTLGWLPVLLLVGAAIAFLGPRLVQDGGLPIRGFGAMLLLAIVGGVGLSAWRARRSGWDPELVYSLCFWLCLSGIVGARLFYIVQYRDDFRAARPGQMLIEMLNIAQGGIVFYGSIFGAVAAGLAFAVMYKVPVLAMADVLAPGVALGIALGRVGCFLNGCCYGGACDLPWAVQFPQGSPPHFQQVRDGELYLHGLRFREPAEGPAIVSAVEPSSHAAASGIRPGDQVTQINGQQVVSTRDAWREMFRIAGANAPLDVHVAGQAVAYHWVLPDDPERSLKVHPTQLYSTIGGLLICLALLAYDPLRRHDGEVIALLATLYPIERFLIEILRDDELGVFNTGLTISQNISLGMFALGLVLWGLALTRPRGSFRAAPAAA